MMTEISDFSAMKREIAEMCHSLSDVPEGVVFNCKLIASELIANVLRHGGGKAYFDYARENCGVTITVRGENRFCPPASVGRADVYAESGRGLYLVDALCDRREYSEETGIRVFLKIGI